MAEAKEPSTSYGRKPKEQITNGYKLAEVNAILDMGRKNKILSILSHGDLIFTHLHTLCNGGNSYEFKPLLDRMILAGDIEKRVNGKILYSITDQGKAKVKQLKKASKKLFI